MRSLVGSYVTSLDMAGYDELKKISLEHNIPIITIEALIRATGYSAILFVALILIFLLREGLPALGEVPVSLRPLPGDRGADHRGRRPRGGRQHQLGHRFDPRRNMAR